MLRFPRNDERGEGHDGGGGCAGTTEEGEGNDGCPQPRRPWVPAYAGTTEREAGTTIGVGDERLGDDGGGGGE